MKALNCKIKFFFIVICAIFAQAVHLDESGYDVSVNKLLGKWYVIGTSHIFNNYVLRWCHCNQVVFNVVEINEIFPKSNDTSILLKMDFSCIRFGQEWTKVFYLDPEERIVTGNMSIPIAKFYLRSENGIKKWQNGLEENNGEKAKKANIWFSYLEESSMVDFKENNSTEYSYILVGGHNKWFSPLFLLSRYKRIKKREEKRLGKIFSSTGYSTFRTKMMMDKTKQKNCPPN